MEKTEKDTERKKGKIMQMKAFKVLKKKLDADADKPVLVCDESDIDTSPPNAIFSVDWNRRQGPAIAKFPEYASNMPADRVIV